MAQSRLFFVAFLVLAICQSSSAGRVRAQSNRVKSLKVVAETPTYFQENPPFVVADDIAYVVEDQKVYTCVDVLANDEDPEGNLVQSTIQISNLPTNGDVFIDDTLQACYLPHADFFGADIFTYTVCDSLEECQLGTVRVTVIGVNDAPLTRDDTATVEEDEYYVIADVLANDEDVDGRYIRRYSLEVVESPKFGKAEVTRDNRIVYTPLWTDKVRFHDVDTLIYQICDNEKVSLCSYATLTITVKDKCIACERCEDFVPTFNLHRDRVDHFFHSDVLGGSHP